MRWTTPDAVEVLAGEEARSRLTIGGAEGIVEGRLIEAVAALDASDPVAGYLFFLSHDVPYEESLSITLTDPALRTLDRATLGAAYSTGAWRDAAIEGPGRVGFGFFDARRWTVTVLPAPALRMPFAGPAGVRRPIGVWRHFDVEAGPRAGG